MTRCRVVIVTWCTVIIAWPVLAQSADAPSTQQMIEQLQRPKTRSLRNLTVEAVPTMSGEAAQAQVEAPAAPPSLSLLIQFDFDSARIRPQSLAALQNLGQAMQSNELRNANFAIEGHTDAKGRADYNLRLSRLRADAVRDALVGMGVAPTRLTPSGKGSTELALPDQPAAAENRRVKIINMN